MHTGMGQVEKRHTRPEGAQRGPGLPCGAMSLEKLHSSLRRRFQGHAQVCPLEGGCQWGLERSPGNGLLLSLLVWGRLTELDTQPQLCCRLPGAGAQGAEGPALSDCPRLPSPQALF